MDSLANDDDLPSQAPPPGNPTPRGDVASAALDTPEPGIADRAAVANTLPLLGMRHRDDSAHSDAPRHRAVRVRIRVPMFASRLCSSWISCRV